MAKRAVVMLIGLLAAGIAEVRPGVAAQAQQESDPAKLGTAGAPAPREVADKDHVASANPLWTIPLGRLTTTRERPLFSASRRPPPPPLEVAKVAPPPPPPPKPVEPEKPPLVLLGTVLGEGGEGIGMFTILPEIKPLRLKVGENHKGWILRDVKQRQVVVEKGRDNAVLELPRHDPKVDPAKGDPAARPTAAPPLRRSDAEMAVTPPQPEPPQQTLSQQAVPPQPQAGPPPLPQAAPPPQMPQAVATISVQPPIFAPPPPQVNPFAGSVHLR